MRITDEGSTLRGPRQTQTSKPFELRWSETLPCVACGEDLERGQMCRYRGDGELVHSRHSHETRELDLHACPQCHLTLCWCD